MITVLSGKTRIIVQLFPRMNELFTPNSTNERGKYKEERIQVKTEVEMKTRTKKGN